MALGVNCIGLLNGGGQQPSSRTDGDNRANDHQKCAETEKVITQREEECVHFLSVMTLAHFGRYSSQQYATLTS